MIRAAILSILLITPAHAMSCAAVRAYVAKYGENTAMIWARSHGYTERQIEAARRCLK